MQTLGAAVGSELVVMVDDDEDLRLIVRDVLEEAGFEVIECRDLSSAFALLDRLVPDIVLLDRDLPDGSGLDVARWLRNRSAYDHVRIIGLSGRNGRLDIEAALAAGCDTFVTKPCSAEKLTNEIRATSKSSETWHPTCITAASSNP
jgi:DNA-binding response OmpR family regulator